jgi:hypothetical protein
LIQKNKEGENMFPTFDYDDYQQEQSYFGNSNIIRQNQNDVYQLNAMRAGGWTPTNGLPKEDPTLPYNLTLNKASLGLPTVNKALYNQFPQQPWDIDPSALCTVENSENHKKHMAMSSQRADRSGWNLLTPTNQEQKLPPDVQARKDGATQVNHGRLQDRRLITQNVTRTTPASGFGSGTSAVPLAYENLNFPTTEPPVGLDNCEGNEGYSFMDSDKLGFVPDNSQRPKWSQEQMGASTDDTAGMFNYQGNTRYLMSHKDPVSGKTYMVFGRDPLLENSGKVYDEVPSRMLGKTNRRLEDMMGNRRLTSPMPNKTEVPNQLVIPDKPGLARAEYEEERRNLERRVAKSNFFVRDNQVRPPPPEAARTSTGAPYTGFVGIREMARYDNVNQPSMKEPEFAARKYETTIFPQTNVTVRSENVPEMRQTFFVAGLGGSSNANGVDPVGLSNVNTKPSFNQLRASDLEANDEYLNESNVLRPVSAVVHGFGSVINSRDGQDNSFMTPQTYLSGNVNNVSSNEMLSARAYEDTSFLNENAYLQSSVAAVTAAVPQVQSREIDENYFMNENNRMQAPVSGVSFAGMPSKELLDDSSSILNSVSKLSAPFVQQKQVPYQLTTMDDFISKDDLNSVTRLAVTRTANAVPALDTDFNLVMPDSLQSESILQTNVSVKPNSIYQTEGMFDNVDKDFMQTATSLSTNIAAPNVYSVPVRGYENINSDVQMNVDHSFMPTFGHGGMNTANQVPKFTDNGQVDNDRVIPWDWLSGSRRVEENVNFLRDMNLPSNFRVEMEMSKEPYLSDLRTYQEVEAAKFKNGEESTVSLRRMASDTQKVAFDAYARRRALRKSMPRNPDSDTDTDCDISK